MKVLFAVNDEKDSEAITRAYQKEYKEIITSKTVYYFNAIIKELQKDKTYDRIVISEDLELFASDNYQTVDKFIFEKMDAISDEATNEEGNDIPIILLGMDRRTKNDPLLVKLFGLGLYNVLVGQDRSIQKVAALMYKPRSKKEAKAYYKVESDEISYSSAKKSDEVSENEIQNILNHYKKIGDNIPKCVQSFDSIASQYNKDQIKLIIEVLPSNTRAILENNSDSYRKIMGIKGKKNPGVTNLKNHEYVEKEIDSGSKLTQPVIIPTAVSTKTVNKVASTRSKKNIAMDEEKMIKEKERLAREKAEAKRKAEEKIAREKAEAKRKEEERIAREKAEAKRKEEERLAREKAEAKRKEEERLAREKAEAKRKEEERLAKEKEEKMKKEEIENANVAVVKRGRGRPRKNPIEDVVAEDVPVKRRRGRPRKEETIKVEEEKVKENVKNNLEEVVVAKKPNKKNEDDIDLLSTFDDIEDEVNIDEAAPEENLKSQYDDHNSADFEDDDFDFDNEDDFDFEDEDEENEDDFNLDDEDEEDEFDFEDEDEENEEDFKLDDEDEEDDFNSEDENEENEEDFNLDDEDEEDDFDFEDENKENEEDFKLDDEDEEDDFDFEDENEENEEDFNLDDEDEEDDFDFEDENEENEEDFNLDDEDEEEDFDFEDEDEENKDNEKDFSLDDEDEEAFDFEDEEEDNENESQESAEEFKSDDESEETFDFEDEENGEEEKESEGLQHNGAFKEITNKNYKYDNNLANSIKDLKETEERDSYNIDTDNLISSGQKIISFVGTSKNGTSFIVNNLAEVFSNRGINTAILDLTKNKNSYYIYTNNEDELREKAQNCLDKLREGTIDGIEVNKNLTVYTSLPTQDAALDDVTGIIKTLLENYTVVLLDCDFDTDVRYFRVAQEMYLVQSLDVLTIQPLTAFLRDLKVKNILDTNKLRIVINKNIKMNYLNEKVLIGGMSVYNDPAMTYMTELFNKDTIKFVTIPLENQVYVKYLEGLVNCKITTNGYSKYFISSLNKLADMVYPTINGKKAKNNYNDYSNQNKNFENTFSKNTSSVLNKMKKKY